MALQSITKDKVLELHSCKISKSKCFAEHTGLQVDKDSPSFSFLEVQRFLKGVFEEQTKLSLSPNLGNFYRFVNEEQQRQIEAWERQQGGRVYIYSLLSGCMALGFNFCTGDGKLKTEKTEVGEWENKLNITKTQMLSHPLFLFLQKPFKKLYRLKKQMLYVLCLARQARVLTYPKS